MRTISNPRNEKGVAVYVLVLVCIMGILAAFSMYLFYRYVMISVIEKLRMDCVRKTVDFCTEWQASGFGTKPWDWDERPPASCEDFNIVEPTAKRCEHLIYGDIETSQ
jgi:hypothetical protein